MPTAVDELDIDNWQSKVEEALNFWQSTSNPQVSSLLKHCCIDAKLRLVQSQLDTDGVQILQNQRQTKDNRRRLAEETRRGSRGVG